MKKIGPKMVLGVFVSLGLSLISALLGYKAAEFRAPTTPVQPEIFSSKKFVVDAQRAALTCEAPAVVGALIPSSTVGNLTTTEAHDAGTPDPKDKQHTCDLAQTLADTEFPQSDLVYPVQSPTPTEPGLPRAYNPRDDWQSEETLLDRHLDPARVERLSAELVALERQQWEISSRANLENWSSYARMQAVRDINDKGQQIREAIGEQQYDSYLYAIGRANRVSLGVVEVGTPAELAGLQHDDIILTYGDRPVYGIGDMRETQILGDTVRVTVQRQGQKLELNVPRGPLGVRLESTRDDPTPGKTASANAPM